MQAVLDQIERIKKDLPGHLPTLVVAPEDYGKAQSALSVHDGLVVELRDNPSVRPGTAYTLCMDCMTLGNH